MDERRLATRILRARSPSFNDPKWAPFNDILTPPAQQLCLVLLIRQTGT
jgi:hypothetical protein